MHAHKATRVQFRLAAALNFLGCESRNRTQASTCKGGGASELPPASTIPFAAAPPTRTRRRMPDPKVNLCPRASWLRWWVNLIDWNRTESIILNQSVVDSFTPINEKVLRRGHTFFFAHGRLLLNASERTPPARLRPRLAGCSALRLRVVGYREQSRLDPPSCPVRSIDD